MYEIPFDSNPVRGKFELCVLEDIIAGRKLAPRLREVYQVIGRDTFIIVTLPCGMLALYRIGKEGAIEHLWDFGQWLGVDDSPLIWESAGEHQQKRNNLGSFMSEKNRTGWGKKKHQRKL